MEKNLEEKKEMTIKIQTMDSSFPITLPTTSTVQQLKDIISSKYTIGNSPEIESKYLYRGVCAIILTLIATGLFSAVWINFVIDHTVPTATINYDNNSVVNDKYFSVPRTATISVRDNYFEFTELSFDQRSDNDEKMFVLTTTDINGNALDTCLPKVDISDDRQSATIYFEGDANYTITPTDSFMDFSAQAVQLSEIDGTEAAYDFCVDQSVPEFLEVTYSDKSAIEKK